MTPSAEGKRLGERAVSFDLAIPDGADGDAARGILPSAIRQSHERVCTTSRTVELPSPVVMHPAGIG